MAELIDDIQAEHDYQQSGSQTIRDILNSLLLVFQVKFGGRATQAMVATGLLLCYSSFWLVFRSQPELSSLETLFMLVLPTFILNYYVMRSAGILPYIRQDQEAVVSK